MSARALLAGALLLGSVAAAPSAARPNPHTGAQWAAQCRDDDAWDKPGPPFKVYGNTYYVGTCGISAILVDGPEQAAVIDGGPADAGGLVARNIEMLGFKPTHVKVLLHSHEHHDHVGGLAELQRLTGARVLASPLAAPVLASGKPGKDDPQHVGGRAFRPVHVSGLVHQGRNLVIGSSALTATFTPGHTPGALTWQWRSCQGGICKTIVYADSLSAVSSDGYRFSDHPTYLAAFRASIAKIAALKCDILLTPHPSASRMRERLLKGELSDPEGCKAYAARLSKALDGRLAKEAHGG